MPRRLANCTKNKKGDGMADISASDFLFITTRDRQPAPANLIAVILFVSHHRHPLPTLIILPIHKAKADTMPHDE
jgi:hypothetical protein